MSSAPAEPFLNLSSVRESLQRLAAEPTLVIYCGAGVTVDRTSLQWNDLVREVFERSASSVTLPSEQSEAVRTFLADPLVSAKHKASVVSQVINAQDETAHLAPILEELLYSENGWQQGYILRNLARLAVGLAAIGRRIQIVTTNYDDYIERAIVAELDEWDEDPSGIAVSKPGLLVRGVGNSCISRTAARGDSTEIRVDYIHGRKAQGEPAVGRLVFSEDSYSQNRAAELTALSSLFHQDAGVLVVGASLSDEPLVETLIQGRASTAGRYALVVPRGSDERERLTHTVANRLRGAHIGVDILSPESFSQVAQYLDELRITMMLASLGITGVEADEFSYASRLQGWWLEWSESDWHRDHDAHFELMKTAVENIRSYLTGEGVVRSTVDGEVLKVEAWVRINPSVSGDSRHLTHWANSIGPLRTLEALRRERITPWSSIASVSAFHHGRPMLIGLEDLGYQPHASRWQSFLVVPIFVERDHELSLGVAEGEDAAERLTVVGTVPVAVMCLASTLPVSSADGPSASFADPRVTRAMYRRILSLLIGSGRLIAGLRAHSASGTEPA